MKATLTDILQRPDKVKPDGKGGHWALCPCHPDKNPSLHITEAEDGKLLIHCFGCGAQLPDVLDALGFQRETVTPERAFRPQQGGAQILEAAYLYAGGALRKLKYRRSDGSKFCMWQRKDGEDWVNGRKEISPGLYQSHDSLPDIFFLVEGEKDVDNLKAAGMAAVSLPDGAKSKWESSYDRVFEGKRVVILPDNDAPGRKYAQMCAEKLHAVAAAVWLLDLKQAWPDIPEKADISDMMGHFGAKAAVDKVLDLLDKSEKWEPVQEATPDRPRLEIISAPELQAAIIPPVQFLVAGLLPEGTSLICAASKIGKSWMVLDMGLSIAAGEKFLGRDTQQCGVLYLALEDSKGRLQNRMNKVLRGAPAPAQFYFSTEAPNLDDGLLDLLGDLLNQHPEIRLVIIDTLQKIRGRALPREGAYEMDYRHMAAVKVFMDKRGVSVLFVHHIRKMRDDGDPFNMISGTNGIMGAADTAWIIAKDRSSQDATLHITGRDVAQAELIISFDAQNTWKWRCHGSADWINEQRAKLEYQNSPIVKTIRQLLKESKDGQWSGTASELMKEGQRICGYPVAATPHEMGQSIKKLSDPLLENDRILHKTPSNGNAGRKHFFYDQSWVLEAEQNQESIPL